MGPEEKPTSREAILVAVKRLFEGGCFVPRDHCRRRMEQRDISHSALLAVFESPRIVGDPEWDEDYGNWKVTIEGETLDDGTVTLGLAVDLRDEILFLLTVY